MVASLLLPACLAGCTSSTAAPATGTARILVTALDQASSIARITVTVSKGDGLPDFAPMSVDLTASGGQWTGRISGIPAGAGRAFDAVAYDAAGARLYSGSAKSDIAASTAAIVTILFQQSQQSSTNSFPAIDALSASRDVVGANGTVQLAAQAHDPDPGDSLSYGWRATCGVFDDTSKASPVWTAPTMLGACQISITVADNHGAQTTAALTLNVVATGDAVVTASFNASPVIAGMIGSVTLGSTLQGAAAVVAADPDGDPLTYGWSTTCSGLVFDQTPPYGASIVQFTLPTPSSSCSVTVTVSDDRGGSTTGTLVLPPGIPGSSRCTGVTCQSGQQCDAADGVCKPIDLCVATGVSCTATDLCHLAGRCNPLTGACDAQTAKTCPGGQVCDGATGNCVASNLCAGVTCTASDPCHVAGSCDPATGSCGAETPRCAPGQTCDPATGQCSSATAGVPVLAVARDVEVSPAAGLAMDASGNVFLAAGIASQTPIDFDGHKVTSTGDFDVFLARYDASGTNVWAVGFGDALGGPQLAVGAAVTQDGTLATIGNFSGSMTIGTTISSAAQIDFLAAVHGSNGTGMWARSFNNGSNGVLRAVAANPNDASAHGNRIAVCGLASAAATDLVPGATFGGQNDIVVAVFTSNGTRLWSRQIGTSSNEECDAVAVDDDGNVYAAGKFDGASLTIPDTPALTGPGNGLRKFLWVAKFDGGTGAGLASAAFGNTAGQAAPTGIAARAGVVALVGNFTSALPFGGIKLTSAGGTDAFAAALAPSTLAPSWAVRLGGTASDSANGVALTAQGDVLVTGNFNKTTTGAAALTAASTAAPDAFLLKLDGGTGATGFAAAYGDTVTQSGDAVAVDGAGAVAFVGTLNGSTTFAPAGTVTAMGPQDVFLVIGSIQ
jgi:hypothetical protein